MKMSFLFILRMHHCLLLHHESRTDSIHFVFFTPHLNHLPHFKLDMLGSTTTVSTPKTVVEHINLIHTTFPPYSNMVFDQYEKYLVLILNLNLSFKIFLCSTREESLSSIRYFSSIAINFFFSFFFYIFIKRFST